MFTSRPVFGYSRRAVIITAASTVALTSTYVYLSSPARLDSSSSTPVTKRRPGPLWSPPSRSQMLAHLKTSGIYIQRTSEGGPEPGPVLSREGDDLDASSSDDVFDLLIVGGGATGAGTALDAASRGLKVACVERDDFASGTSSKSTKLVHGGVRYLQKAVMELDYEQWKLVKEALRERRIFLETAPHLSSMLPILLPIYTWWQLPYYYAGCKLYDILAGKENMESAYWMGKGKALEAFPMLKKDGLVGGVVYYDGQHNDSRMNISLIMTAVQHGAIVANHTEVTRLHKKYDPSKGCERIYAATLKDNMTNEEFIVKCRGVINATGPFSDGLRKLDEPTTQEIVAPSAGVHITLPNYYGPKTMGLLDPATSDGRVIFFLPWQGNVIAGTTDSPTPVSQNPVPAEKDIQWILDEVRNYLSPDVKVRRGDVLSAWSGIRPLVRDPAAKNTQSLVRNHMINVSKSGLLTIAGGKWTTYRAMAEETVDQAIKEFDLKPNGPSQTDHIKLLGAHAWSKTMYIKLIQQFGLETEVAKHLAESYGDRAWDVASMADPTGYSWPVHGIRISPLYPYIEAEARYACRKEYALTAVDFIARRTRLSFLNVRVSLECLPRIVDIMSEELGWDTKRKEKEFDNAQEFLRSMGLPEGAKLKLSEVARSKSIGPISIPQREDQQLFERAQFSPAEVSHLKTQFHQLDFDNDSRITRADLLKAMTQMGYDASAETADNILREVDFGRKGAIEFQDYLDIAAGLKELHLENAFTHLARMDSSRQISSGNDNGAIGKHAKDSQEENGERGSRRKIPVERSGGGT
ncbi:putative glycerol-3-phosphate dehydrogenase [Kockovaella imperatae]|uniref:Glycerol-3-phosphate dehydrogenase n=1 Tax=Kockovaella imperatae TaxID=4999 RepID=A0A1Y1U8A8_9TREE|nr:putative glycerol-3-phosphate dehydrogenase [Kockovaella imperatae]ORX34271.1 putative glycerol-3-phosphate dehydrogenase [Kockovaella imperatae]